MKREEEEAYKTITVELTHTELKCAVWEYMQKEYSDIPLMHSSMSFLFVTDAASHRKAMVQWKAR